MLAYTAIISLLPQWNANKIRLVCANMVIGILLIICSFFGVFPLAPINFLFFSFVLLLLGLYRPGWFFLLIVGMLPYESINMAPVGMIFTLRPYQWLLFLFIPALCIRLFFRRFPVETFRPHLLDMLPTFLIIGSFLSALTSENVSLAMRQSVILLTFLMLYFMGRIFVRSYQDIRMILPFILSSGVIIAIYAIIQNSLSLFGYANLAVMTGRPNAVFTEADWLGGYLAVIITILTSLIIIPKPVTQNTSLRCTRSVLALLLWLCFTALIITVSRSAWLATVGALTFLLLVTFWQRGGLGAWYFHNMYVLKRMFFLQSFITVPFLLAMSVVIIFHLTPFDLFDRSKSVVSGEQKITVSCQQPVVLPEKINSLEELSLYHCGHIQLENKDIEMLTGKYVTEVKRDDPNINIRQDIYARSFSLLKEHWVMGIGFGIISQYLGTDGRGAGLNASNLFLEVWLGAGIIGFLAFTAFWFWLGLYWIYRGIIDAPLFGTALSAVWVATTLFNVFNSGLFLGWLFLLMACLMISYFSYDQR
ncbi:MAG: O-antigen ligase family protein [Minisyncoccota bacterium]